jgi:thioredoxin family protein
MTTSTDEYYVHCPACGAANRVPGDREGQAGRCGSCHAGLPPLYLHPQVLAEGSFTPFVSGYPGPVLAEFWAPW